MALRSRMEVGGTWIVLPGIEVEEWLVEWPDGSRTWEKRTELRVLQ